jgi:hypothetical protein
MPSAILTPMLKPDQIPGLLHAIDLFSPAIEKHRRILADEEGSPLYITEHVRGILRTYALVVGGLKIELERAQGLDFAPRFVAHDDSRRPWKRKKSFTTNSLGRHRTINSNGLNRCGSTH